MGIETFFENLILNASHVFALLGYIVFFVIIFAESGLFFGFFLPGDSLLILLGLLSSQGYFNLWLLILFGVVAAITGDSVGYVFGKKLGPKLFQRENSLLFNKKNLKRASDFYDQHGATTIVLARFTPIVRTFAPIVAGASNMKYRVFLTYNIIGGVLWISSLLSLSYFFGKIIPGMDKYIVLISVSVIILSLLPTILHLKKTKTVKKPQPIKE